MALRLVTRELESRLQPTGAEDATEAAGKVERKTYSDGSERLKIVLRGLASFEGSTAVVSHGENTLAEVVIVGGKGRWDRKSQAPGVVPVLFEEAPVEVRIEGLVVARGRVEHD